MISVNYCCSLCRFSDGGRLDGGEGGPKYAVEHNAQCDVRQRDFDAITPAWAVTRIHAR